MSHLVGASDLRVRLPFIALFAVTTWLMFRLGTALYGARAGLLAAVASNLSPVFSVTTGTWVLPDGPLDCALVGAALCLSMRCRRGTAGGGGSAPGCVPGWHCFPSIRRCWCWRRGFVFTHGT